MRHIRTERERRSNRQTHPRFLFIHAQTPPNRPRQAGTHGLTGWPAPPSPPRPTRSSASCTCAHPPDDGWAGGDRRQRRVRWCWMCVCGEGDFILGFKKCRKDGDGFNHYRSKPRQQRTLPGSSSYLDAGALHQNTQDTNKLITKHRPAV